MFCSNEFLSLLSVSERYLIIAMYMQWSRNIKNIGGPNQTNLLPVTLSVYWIAYAYLTQISSWVIIGRARPRPPPASPLPILL